jgi:hypothetical protein
MANYQTPGVLCAQRGGHMTSDGSMVCVPGRLPGVVGRPDPDQALFQHAMDELQATVANAGGHLVIDSEGRRLYTRMIAEMSDDLKRQVAAGRLTWREAAVQAQETRNTIMEFVRARTTPVGRARAEALKKVGKTLDELVEHYARQLYGAKAEFGTLTVAQQNQVYAEIVASAGRSRESVTIAMQRMSRAGKGLLILSLAMSVYVVATADDKVDAAKHEGAATLAGIGGGIAGGAAAGLVCGPGAPVCVTVGAVVGGALAAFGVDYFHLW